MGRLVTSPVPFLRLTYTYLWARCFTSEVFQHSYNLGLSLWGLASIFNIGWHPDRIRTCDLSAFRQVSWPTAPLDVAQGSLSPYPRTALIIHSTLHHRGNTFTTTRWWALISVHHSSKNERQWKDSSIHWTNWLGESWWRYASQFHTHFWCWHPLSALRREIYYLPTLTYLSK